MNEKDLDSQREGMEPTTKPLRGVHRAAEVEAVVAGHVCLDIAPTLPESAVTFTPGHAIEAGKAVLAPGGPAANTGLALYRLGLNTRLMGKVGDDLFGRAIVRSIGVHGLDVASSMLVVPNEESAYAVVLSPARSERVVVQAAGCSATFGADDIRYPLLKTAGLFYFCYSPFMVRMSQDNGAELATLFERAKACGITTALDIALPDPANATHRVDWSALLATVLPFVDVFLPALEDLLFMLRRPLFDKLASKAGSGHVLDLVTPEVVSDLGKLLLNMGAKIVGIKVGQRGVYLCTASTAELERLGRAQPPKLMSWAKRELWSPCFTVQAVNTYGASDVTSAGFLLGLMRGMSPEATLSAANAVRAGSVETADTLSGVKSWPETLERIAAGWPRLLVSGKGRSALDLPSFGWRWHASQEVWQGPKDPRSRS